MLSFVARTYTPHNSVVSVAGNLDHEYTVGLVSRELADWEVRPVPSFLPAVDADQGPGLRVDFKETEQAHLCIGLRGLSVNDPDYFGLRILNVILGEGMSSRLFLEIREKRGLAYSVGSYASFLSDTGAVILHAGVPPQQTGDTISAMLEQLDLLRAKEVPRTELTKSKEFLKGRILLRMEDTFANAQWFGKQEVLNQEVLTVDQVIERLDEVTAADVRRLAQQLFVTEQLRLAVIGPFKEEGDLAARLRL
jgi:predicted Zn-dependent peptidase